MLHAAQQRNAVGGQLFYHLVPVGQMVNFVVSEFKVIGEVGLCDNFSELHQNCVCWLINIKQSGQSVCFKGTYSGLKGMRDGMVNRLMV